MAGEGSVRASLVRFREVPAGFRRRLGAATLASFAAFAFLGLRLWDLQLVHGPYYRELADHNRIRLKRVRPTRGLIFDRNDRILAENRPSYDVVMVPEDAGDPRAILARLREYLGDSDAVRFRHAVFEADRPPFEPVVLESDVDWPTLVVVETHQPELPGVSLGIGPRRSYPFGAMTAHLLGYVGEVSPTDLGPGGGYRMGDTIGKYGLERFLESALRGRNGGQQVEVDVVGRELRVLREVAAVSGSRVHLTIDIELQRAAHDALEGREGAVVVMDPRDGSILAMVSRPGFDPNVFATGIPRAEWQRLVSDPLRPLADKARQGQFPPGSVFKIVTAAAALEENVINPFTRIFCGGSHRHGDRDFRCWRRVGHGWVDVQKAIIESCDVFFYQVAQRLGVDTIAEYAGRFGLGQPTGLELEDERSGTIPTKAWKRKVFGEPWYSGETLSVAIGQGYVTATPLQLASLISTIASGGIRHPPRLVDRLDLGNGKLRPLEKVAPIDVGLHPRTIAQLQSALRDTVQLDSGTGKNARIPGIQIGGKTGTSQTARLPARPSNPANIPRRLRDHAWFVAFGPVDDPEIAISVLVEHAGEGGGKVAAPIARKVLQYYFGSKGREADADRSTIVAAR